MTCYAPLEGYRTANGAFTYKRAKSIGKLLVVPCRNCIGCRLDHARSWAIRCVHEFQTQKEIGQFITLTYRDADLPPYGSLLKSDFQKFIRALRDKYKEKIIRYYHCGEYGGKLGRPHYHAIIYGHQFTDLERLPQSYSGKPLYTSQILKKIWGKGHVSIGSVTIQSAAYIARYVVKKQNGEKAKAHYMSQPDHYGEINAIIPEYTTMSLKPGLGQDWYDQYGSELFPDNYVIHDGKKLPVPVFYKKQYAKTNPKDYARILEKQKHHHQLNEKNNTPERLRVRQRVAELNQRRFKRELEET